MSQRYHNTQQNRHSIETILARLQNVRVLRRDQEWEADCPVCGKSGMIMHRENAGMRYKCSCPEAEIARRLGVDQYDVIERATPSGVSAPASGLTRSKKTPATPPSPTPPGIVANHPDQFVNPIVCVADVTPTRVDWLWGRRIPLGKVTILDGDPGLGKSTIALDVGARLTRGESMPGIDEAVPPADVLVLSAEDGVADTIRPRLEAAGAVLSRVHAWPLDTTPLTLPDHIEILENTVRDRQIRYVIIDVLVAFMSGQLKSHNDQDVRKLLSALAKLAESTGAAVLCLRHLNKTSGPSAIYRGGGSIGITGAARSVLLVGRNPNNPSELVLAQVKSNLAMMARAISYTLADTTHGVARVEWGEESDLTADMLVCPTGSTKKSRQALESAQDLLIDALQDGGLAVKELERRAQEVGMSKATLRRAKDELGVKARKIGYGGEARWVWEMPETQTVEDAQVKEDAHAGEVSTFGISDRLQELPPRLEIMEIGRTLGFPKLTMSGLSGGCVAWASGETAWRNRSERADSEELAPALAAAKAIEGAQNTEGTHGKDMSTFAENERLRAKSDEAKYEEYI